MEIDLVLVGASRREQIQMGPMGLTRRFVLVLVLESGRAE
jgi:hypothetical protein